MAILGCCREAHHPQFCEIHCHAATSPATPATIHRWLLTLFPTVEIIAINDLNERL
jgi:hypothetical protein